MYQNPSESQNIKWSVIVLSFSLVLVYIILYYAKGDLWKQDFTSTNIDSLYTGILVSEIEDAGGLDEFTIESGTVVNTGDMGRTNYIGTSGSADTDGEDNLLVSKDVDMVDTLEDNGSIILSGTKTYYGKLDFVEKMGISYEYALKDDKNIYYLYMGKYDYDFSDIVRKLGGSLYVMNTEQELIANGLFGEKVTYINIPEYKDKKVLMLLEVDNQSWLLAIDYAIYYQVKPYLKTLFID